MRGHAPNLRSSILSSSWRRAGFLPTDCDSRLDGRGLEPPEPMQRVLAAFDVLRTLVLDDTQRVRLAEASTK